MTLGGYDLRQVGPGAEDLVLALQREAYARTREITGNEPIPLTWDYQAVLAECETWICEDAQGPVAALILRERPADLYIESLATVPRVAGSGLGTALMQFAARRASELGRSTIRLLTNGRNPARLWYQRLGFRIERQEVESSGRVILHMARNEAVDREG